MENDVALFVDLDNIAIGAMEANLEFDIRLILEYVQKLTKGRMVLRRAYGDWRQHRNIPKALANAGFELQSTVNQMSKNLADMQMVVDAMETMIDGQQFATYVLVTGDRDFMPLVQALRKRGKVVIGMGVRHTSSKNLHDICDKFVYYEDVVAGMSQLPVDESVPALLQRALAGLLTDRPRVPASMLKQHMGHLSQGAFLRSPQGKMSFSKFLSQYPELVQMTREETTVYVSLPGQEEAPRRLNGRKRASQANGNQNQALEDLALHLRYRAGLKRQGMRVVPASPRMQVLKALVALLQAQPAQPWRAIVASLYERCARQPGNTISKSYINDVLRLARRAEVIHLDLDNDRFSTLAPVSLALKGEHPFQDAVMACDAAYMRGLQTLDETLDLDEAAVALYGTVRYRRYLKILQQRFGSL